MNDQQPCRILVVDDEPDIVRFVQISLEREGFTVATAANGRDALHQIADEKPDLIVLDVMMPEVDGFEVLRRLKENEATAHIPVMILTAKDAPPSVASGLEIGADFYWTKPFNTSDLVRVIKLILTHHGDGDSEDGTAPTVPCLNSTPETR